MWYLSMCVRFDETSGFDGLKHLAVWSSKIFCVLSINIWLWYVEKSNFVVLNVWLCGLETSGYVVLKHLVVLF